MSACSLTVGAGRVTYECSFTNHRGWIAELAVGIWLVVPTAGFEHTRVDLTRFETLRTNAKAQILKHSCRQNAKSLEIFKQKPVVDQNC